MVDEQEPAKRVVKRVVKKAVVRPTTPADPAPKLRYGRPVATTAPPRAKVASRPGRTTTSPEREPAAPRPAKVARQRINVRSRLDTGRRHTATAWRAVSGGAGTAAHTGGSFVAARARTVAAWRLPHINPHLAAAVTGAVVGLVSVLLGVISLAIFDAVRGVSSGGGLWGGLAFVAIAVVAVLVGESLLRGFGSPSARLTSFLGVVLVIIAMLGLFLELTDSIAAFALIPLLGVVAYSLAHWLIDAAERTPPVID
ncbi:MAG: hypothetical protein ABW075_07680 [Aeromicrobium sp.]